MEHHTTFSDFYQGRPVLVTGATGFVGGHLAAKLSRLGARVKLLVRQSADPKKLASLQSLGAEMIYGDITDASSVREAVKGCEIVFHIAALFREAKFPDSAYYAVNVDGTRHVLDASIEAGVKRVVHCSTIGVHSHIPNPPAAEDEPYRPGDVYQVSKTEGEKLALDYFQSGKIDGVVIRPAMIWGEGDRRLLKLFAGVAKRRMPIIGDGKTWTHWVYVHDLVQGILLAGMKPEASGQVYIFAGETPKRMEEVFQVVAKRAGVSPLPVRVPALPLQILGSLVELICRPLGIEPPLHRRRVDFFTKNRCFDISKAKRELGYQPANDFDTEVDNIYSWYEKQRWLS